MTKVHMQFVARVLTEAPFTQVSFGAGGITLVSAPELQVAQRGYSIGPDGESLEGGGPGGWNEQWLVIGHDDLLGDPIFIDLSQPEFPVYTAEHGADEWEPIRIADSLEGLLDTLRVIRTAAIGRESPVALERHPLLDDERAHTLRSIQQLNPGVELDYWEMLLEADV